ncbi:hypothetical protein [Sphingomonas sp.]|uniref:hypothetical protein n=1 Tax=Sphingomonas sp. TaxID=28214 RepID=UPI0025F87252|nr:hypothetical protein [Sphingomonas sp.]
MNVKADRAHDGAMKMLVAVMLVIAPSLARAETITLTPEQAERAKEAGAARNAQDAALGLEPGRDKSIHGEMGVAIGTGGYRSMYGTAIVPLGDSATLGLSFEREQFNDRYGRYRRGY